MKVLLLTGAFAASLLFGAAEAAACVGPDTMQRVEANVPSNGATNVGLTPTVAVQLGQEDGYPGEGLFGGFSGEPVLTLMDEATGEIVEQVDAELVAPWEEAYERTLITHPTMLQPNTTYLVSLEQDGSLHQWSFTTGDGEIEPFAPPPSFEMNLDAYWGSEPRYTCCPEQFVGECPRCFEVGDNPLATVSAGFDLLPHPEGPGAFVYTLERRANVDGSAWGAVGTGAFSDDESGRLLYERPGRTEDLCYRVLARSVIEPFMEYESNEACRDGAEHFSDPPAHVPNDNSLVMCGDEDVDDTPDDPQDPDGEDPDEDDNTPDDPEDDGWELGENGAKPTDSGCGCSSTRSELPGSLLFLGLALFGLRRRR